MATGRLSSVGAAGAAYSAVSASLLAPPAPLLAPPPAPPPPAPPPPPPPWANAPELRASAATNDSANILARDMPQLLLLTRDAESSRRFVPARLHGKALAVAHCQGLPRPSGPQRLRHSLRRTRRFNPSVIIGSSGQASRCQDLANACMAASRVAS